MRLIPREEKFYTDFQSLADELHRGAELLEHRPNRLASVRLIVDEQQA